MFKLRWRTGSPPSTVDDELPVPVVHLAAAATTSSGPSTVQDSRLELPEMRLLRGMGRLRLVSMLLFVVAMVYAVGVLRSSYSLDNINSDSRAGESDKGGLSLRRVKSSYHDDDNDLVYYKKDVPLIWVGGVPRSGTTLMRVLLDAHRDVRCGEETRVIPRLLSMHSLMMKSRKEVDRLTHAKITEGVLDNAQAAYILSIISEHGEKALRLCNKDPFALKSMSKILKMFPQSKFIFMVRDGRATVHSIISRHVTIKGFNIESYRGALQDWNRAIEFMHNECKSVGPQACLPVFYEQLVLHPQSQMRNILTFLDLDWDDMVLHHEKTINKTGGASVSGIELSTDQVERPINTEALTSWVSFIPADVRKDMRKIAPMLQVLGYDPDAYPPNYGEPDDIVKEADLHLKQDNKFYQERKPKHPVLPQLGPLRLYINSKTPTSSINATKLSPPKH